MKHIDKFVLIFALSWLVACAGPKEFVMKSPPTQPSAKQFPKASAVILLHHVRIVVAGNGKTFKKHVHVQIKALTKYGLKYIRSVRADYDAQSKISNFHARLIRPHGWISKPMGSFDVSINDRSSEKISSVRAKKKVFSNLLPGSVLEYRFTKTNVSRDLLYHYFQGKIPTVKSIFEVSVPSRLALRRKIHSGSNFISSKIKFSKQTEPTSASRTLFRWTAAGIPSFKKEVAMPSKRVSSARVSLQLESFFYGKYKGQGKSWNDIAAFYHKISSKQQIATPYLTKFTKALVKDAKSKEAKIRTIYDFVRKEIRYISVTFGLGGLKGQPAIFTLKNRYGDCKAKAILVSTMLSVIGVKSRQVLVMTRRFGPLDQNFPTSMFDHVINYLPDFKGGSFIDATTEDNRLELLRWDDQGASGLIVNGNKGKFVTIPSFDSKKNLYHQRLTLRLKRKENKVLGELLIRRGGNTRVFLDGKFERKELSSLKKRKKFFTRNLTLRAVRRIFESRMPKKGKLKISSVDFSGKNKAFLNTTIKFSLLLKKKRKKVMWLPLQFLPGSGINEIALKKRTQHAIFWSSKVSRVGELILKGWTPLEVPGNLSLSSKHLAYTASTQKRDKFVHYKRSLVFKSDMIPLADHAAYRKHGFQIRERSRRLIVLKEGSLDKDKDGVPDDKDKCPTVPGEKKFEGCPDSDGDGIGNHLDACPNLKGIANDKDPKKNGCPKIVLVKVTDKEIKILQKIFFAFGRARINRKSYPILDQIIAVLKTKSKIRIQIEGHTDNAGSAKGNKRLSKKRARAVFRYLIKKGKFEKERFKYVGFGPDKPLVPNTNKKNKAKNRRVQFTIIK